MALSSLNSVPGQVESLVRDVQYHPDPITVMEHFSESSSSALLLESAEIESKNHLKSILMLDAAVEFECWNNRVSCRALTENGKPIIELLKQNLPSTFDFVHSEQTLQITVQGAEQNTDEANRLIQPSVFDVLRCVINTLSPLRQHPLAVFLGGVFAYDLIACYEELPDVIEGENTCPDFLFYLAETLITFDHQTHSSQIIGSVYSGENVAQQYFNVAQKIESIESMLASIEPTVPAALQNVEHNPTQINVDKTDDVFCNDVEQLKQRILAGDIFQVVPSRTFSLACTKPLEAFKALKQSNPSPYMFYLKTQRFTLLGASPESALKYSQADRQVEVYPIAGTRPRGKYENGSINKDLDSRLELELREDEKERAEHIMLVDLARNDVAKVSKPGSRYVKELLNVDRYSHVMHLVSRVVGTLKEELDALHAYQACMNMGTLVGAPKVSAASLIRHIEKKRRGSYGGAVGYINNLGDMDTCIVIRSAFVANGIAHVQAGAGVVHDSNPQAEADETRNKANAVIHAIAQSEGVL